MRVKIFEKTLAVQHGDTGGGSLCGIESKINDWLGKNPDIEVVDIKMSFTAGPLQDAPTNFAVLCLVLYKEKP